MKELVVISGKGGTGKTSLTAALADLLKPVALADCDVDAADLHLLARPEPTTRRREPFHSGWRVQRGEGPCTACGLCVERCRFGALAMGQAGDEPTIDLLACEGCGACVDGCPAGALRLVSNQAGWLISGRTRFGPLVHAELAPAQSNSGRLATEVRQRAQAAAAEEALGLVLTDGSPGVGCQVIASLAGATAALVVTEPSVAGLHDLQRVLELCAHFLLPAHVVVNKADLNESLADQAAETARRTGAKVVGRIGYSTEFTTAMLTGRAVTEVDARPALRRAVEGIAMAVRDRLG